MSAHLVRGLELDFLKNLLRFRLGGTHDSTAEISVSRIEKSKRGVRRREEKQNEVIGNGERGHSEAQCL